MWLSMSAIILITPAFRIFIWGLPTFHWMATRRTLFSSCSESGPRAICKSGRVSRYSMRTRVSIRTSKSLWGLTIHSKICSISWRNRLAYEQQLRTIVSNLKRFLLVRFQPVYSLVFMMRYRMGPISEALRSAILAKPAFWERRLSPSAASFLLISVMDLVASTLTNIWKAIWSRSPWTYESRLRRVLMMSSKATSPSSFSTNWAS